MGLRRAIVRTIGKNVLAEVAAEAAKRALAEAYLPGSGVVDADESQWRRLNGGGSTRDLNPWTHDAAIEACYQLYVTNPLGRRITEINRDYIVGDGITWSARNPNLEDVIGRFWTDHDNDLDRRNVEFANEMGLYGELPLQVLATEVSGVVKLGYIDPAQIKGVNSVPGNPLILDTVKVRGKGFGIGGKTFDILRWRGGELGGHLEGDVAFVKVNSVSNATRGWPDLLAVADWLNAYDELLWNIIERSALMRSFIWDVTLKGPGVDEKFVRDWLARHGATPKTGTVRAHSENETWEAVAPTLGSYEAAKEAEVILDHIAAGTGTPKHWLMNAGDVNRATAIDVGAPTIRRLSRRQKDYISVLRLLCAFAMQTAEGAGRLHLDADGKLPAYDADGNPTGTTRKPMELLEINAPEISVRDMRSASEILVNITDALDIAANDGWIDQAPIRQVLRVAFAQLGYNYDPSHDVAPPKPNEEVTNAPVGAGAQR